jgi:monoamine oxidase
MVIDVDVAIVGAGVAGLAAMRHLEERGVRTLVAEARDRIGGRIYTTRDHRLPYPIELGAEFIHGSAPELIGLLGEEGLVSYAIQGNRWRMQRGRIMHADDYWERLHVVMRGLKPTRTDRSFADFLRTKPGGRAASDERTLARHFVEGFHGADTERVSANALADGGSPSEDPEEQRIMRIADGYSRVPEWLARDYGSRIVTGTVVERIEWRRGDVHVVARGKNEGAKTTINARAAIITVPLGVLLTQLGEVGAIEFVPKVPLLENLESLLTMGTVRRVVLLFRERWWTKHVRGGRRKASLDALSFVYGTQEQFQVWWTLHPAHLPAMVGWSGGPPASRLAGLDNDEILGRAITSLAGNLGVSKKRVSSQVEGCWTHDWEADPFSRGAYSYALVGGADAAKKLSRPVERTLWFAGEAADSEGRNGTVHGAIGSGRDAATSVLRSRASAHR